MTVSFFVAGRARTAGSKRAGVAYRRGADGEYEPARTADGRIKTFVKDSSGKKGDDWRTDVRAAATEAMAGRPPQTRPVVVDVTFYTRRPKGHYGTGRRSDLLRSSAAAFPSSRSFGDIDKLVRSLLDSIKDIVITDDALVVDLYARKRYADSHAPGAQVQIGDRSEMGASLSWRTYDDERKGLV